MAAVNIAFWKLLFKIAGRQTGEISEVMYFPQKPRYEDRPIRQPFPRATPESQGISSQFIQDFLKEMRDDAEANPHQVMLLRHGKVIAECGFAPYEICMWHVTHSLCKAFTGMAVGILVDEGKLDPDESLRDIFPEYVKPLNRIFRKHTDIRSFFQKKNADAHGLQPGLHPNLPGRNVVTVRNLLDMTSGVGFAESGSVSGNDWRAGFLNAHLKCRPGTKFDYNSMNSYMLSAVIQKRTGRTMFEYLKEKLFDPMGIDEVFWEKSPEGITKGGWGMFIRPEDALKLGQLYLRHGRWNGKQLVPEKWVEASSSLQADNGKYGYGYQIWLGERPGSFAYEGLFGQYVVMYPDLDMVVLVNAGNREMMGSGNLTRIIRRNFGTGFMPPDVLEEDPAAQRELDELIHDYETVPKGLKSTSKSEGELKTAFAAGQSGLRPGQEQTEDEYAKMLAGRRYRMEKGNVGVFPLVCQVLHNNFTDGICEVSFENEDGMFILILQEGKTEHRIKVGFDRSLKSEIDLHGESWMVSTWGCFSSDERGRPALICEIAFVEESCSRQLAFFFDADSRESGAKTVHEDHVLLPDGDEIEMRASETPGEDIIAEAIRYTGNRPWSERIPLIKKLADNGGREILEAAVESAIRPSDRGHLIRDDHDTGK